MKKTLLSFAIFGMLLASCGSENTEVENHDETGNHSSEGHDQGGHDHSSHDHGGAEVQDGNISSSDTQNENTSAIIDAYLVIKNGLASDDQKMTADGGSQLVTAFGEFDMTQLSGETHKEYMDIMENAKEQAEHISKNPIDHQREHFEVLSVDINDLVTLLGTSKTLYQDFCPMAAEGKGAIWLSDAEKISNPYMGSKMPGCGEVQKVINE